MVSNSSVLISLSAIGQLDLLHKEFPEGVLIPRAVRQEVVANRTRAVRRPASRLCILDPDRRDLGQQQEGKFRLSKALYLEALRTVGEQE